MTRPTIVRKSPSFLDAHPALRELVRAMPIVVFAKAIRAALQSRQPALARPVNTRTFNTRSFPL